LGLLFFIYNLRERENENEVGELQSPAIAMELHDPEQARRRGGGGG
jgi:hypothetical protein